MIFDPESCLRLGFQNGIAFHPRRIALAFDSLSLIAYKRLLQQVFKT